MARRKQSVVEDIIDITSRFPWWVGLLLAIGSFIALHSVADKGMPAADAGDLAKAARGGMIYGLAAIGQYILPIVFGFGSVVSVIVSSKRKQLHSDVTTGSKQIGEISWQQFEILIGEHFRQQGFKVRETEQGADGGVDLVLERSGEKFLVQCKHWKAYKVGVKPVRELLGVMVGSAATGGYFVTSGEFTVEAIKFARENQIKLIDGKSLNDIFNNKKFSAISSPTFKSEFSKNPSEENNLACPKCGSEMVLRVAKQGKNVGQKFWGCSKFPKCRSVLPISSL